MTRMFLFLICAALLGMGADARVEDRDTLVRKGDLVPGFVVEMFDGGEIDMEDLRGKVVLLNFWATWCPPCQEELKRVEKEIIGRFKERDFVYLPISREDSREQIAKFRERNGYSFPMGLDPERKIFSKFAKSGIPRNFLVDAEGKIVHLELGYSKESFAEMIEQIDKLLAAHERAE